MILFISLTPYEKEKQRLKGKVSFLDTPEGTIMTATTRTKFDVQRYILKRTPCIRVLELEWIRDIITDKLYEGLKSYTTN